jgi:hypothetical protein
MLLLVTAPTGPGPWIGMLLGLVITLVPIVLVVYAVVLLRRVDRKLDKLAEGPPGQA